MPNHVHLLLPTQIEAELARHHLVALTKWSPYAWEPVPPPSITHDIKHIRRQIRYVVLNPSRSRLVSDPLEWPWSTYRGYFGAVASPWVTSKPLTEIFGWQPTATFLPWFHQYVSSDPTVNPSGTSVLNSTQQSRKRHFSLDSIISSILIASESLITDLQKHNSPLPKSAVHLASENEWTQTGLLARYLNASPRSIQRWRNQSPDDSLLRAARICLSDERLLQMAPNTTNETR